MARVFVYVRPVDAVFTDIKLDNSLNPSKYGAEIKNEPFHPDINLFDDMSSVNTNTTDQDKTSGSEDKFVNDINCKNSKSNLDDRERTCEPHAYKSLICNVCFVRFKSKHALNVHKILYKKQHKCDNCNMIFVRIDAFKQHQRSGCFSKIINDLNYACNYCNRSYFTKKSVQCHIFHAHRHLIYFDKTGNEEVPLEMPEKLNGVNDIVIKNLSSSNCTTPKRLSKSNITLSKKLSILLNSPSSKQYSLKKTPSRRLDSSRSTPSKSNDSFTCTPSKRMKQTTITEFISVYKEKPNEECIAPKKVTEIEDIPVFNSGNVMYDSPKSSKVTKVITSIDIEADASIREKPFVQIHVNSNTMISLLNKEIKCEPGISTTPRDTSYNLRPARINSYFLRESSDSGSSETSRKARASRKRKRSDNMPKNSRETMLQYDKLQCKLKCKECVVRLERCDKGLKGTNFKLNESENASLQVDSKKMEENFEKSQNINRISSMQSKSLEIPLKKFVEFEKSISHKLIPEYELEDKSEDGITENMKLLEKKDFQCHFCKKSFSLKKNRRRHMERFHSIYMSSICNARYTSMNKLLNHYSHQHIVFKRKECCVCYEKFNTSVLLKRHMVLHCVKTVRSKKDTLPVDTEMHCFVSKKQYKCQACRKRFWLKSCLKQHEKMCRKMKTQKNEQYVRCTRSFEGKNNVDPNIAGIKRTSGLPSQCSSNKYPISQIFDPERMPFKDARTEFPKKILPGISITADASYSPRHTGANKKSLINGVACVKGYQLDISDKAKFPCVICGKQFQTFQNLCIHEGNFSRPTNNYCSVCGTAFPTKRILQVHMLATHTPSCAERYKFFCKFCNQGFGKKLNLQIHERHFHASHVSRSLLNSEYIWDVSPICNVCNLMFQSYERYIDHNMYYFKHQIFECITCSKSFQGMYKLHHHNKMDHYSDDIRKSYIYKCNICNEGFNYESHFHAHKLHIHSHDTAFMLNDVNTMQDHTYALTPNNVVRVEELAEVSLKRYTCIVCNLNFLNKKDLAMHEIEYSMDGDFQCNKCNRKFRTSSILAKHYSLNHSGDQINTNFKCRFCEEVLTTSTSMRCHEQHFHRNNTNVTNNADRSGKMITNENLRDILKFDNNDNNYTCFTCGMRFCDIVKLKHHLLDYSDIGTFSCTMCRRKFTELYLLEVHKLKHSKLNINFTTYRCPICNEGFTNHISVRIHILHLHRYETFGSNNNKIVNATDLSKAANVTENDLASTSANHKQEENTVKCSECNIAFSSNKNLMKHRSRFMNSGDHQCAVCDRRFPWLAVLAQHMRKHSNINTRFWKHNCPHCMEKFRSSVAVYSHIIHVHGKDKLLQRPSSCADKSDGNNVDTDIVCDKTVVAVDTPMSVVDTQDVNKHTTVNKTEPTCEKIEDLDNLKNSVHYTCIMCNMKCSTLNDLQEHFKEVHVTVCALQHRKDNNCSETTSIKSNNENILCTICNTAFNDEKVFNEHMQNIHVTNPCNSSINQSEHEEVNRLPKKDDDTVKIIWEKTLKPIECITISENVEDSDVQVISDSRSFVNKQNSSSLPEDPISINSDVGKLKVRSFAKYVD